MKRFHCPDCDTEFLDDNAETCPKCGGHDITCLNPEIVSPASSQEAAEGIKEARTASETLPAVRAVLQELCERTYDVTYRSSKWQSLIDEALKELTPFMTA